MLNCIKESFVAKLAMKICKPVLNAYSESRLKRAFKKIGVVVKSSGFYGICSRYYNKRLAYESSLTFKAVSAVARAFDVLAKGLGAWLGSVASGSAVCCAMTSAVKDGFGVAAFFMTVMGVGVGTIVSGLIKGSQHGALLGVGVFVAALVCFLVFKNINFFKRSLVGRFIVWLVK